MSGKSIIVISPSGTFTGESEMINRLFDAGLFRYHIFKTDATEQSIAEILEGITPKFLSQITLHSHYHLVLAYGVGGIHYSMAHRISLGDDYIAKVNLYQGFGVKVSTDVDESDWSPADYAISLKVPQNVDENRSEFIMTKDIRSIQFRRSALNLQDVFVTHSLEDIIRTISMASGKT
jgi:hypothetical protein